MTKSEFLSTLMAKTAEMGVFITEIQAEKLFKYYEILVKTNEHMNLTAITEPEEVIIKHFCDSLAAIKYANFPENATVVDVGTGAGFPGVVLKIAREDIKLTLMDALRKRVDFLESLCEQLEIDADCVHIRAEDAGQSLKYRETFDIAVSRAVAQLRVLDEYCLPLVRLGGSFVALKGKSGKEEVKDAAVAANKLGAKVKKTIEYSLFDAGERVIVIAEKERPTPDKYPRHNSKIKSKPL